MIPLPLATPDVATTPEIDSLLADHAPVAIGVSGGKDSCAVAFATIEHLNRMGHAGPRILIHSDLVATEWKASLPWCEKLAERLGLKLIVVRRARGGMMERWEQRWADNVTRYAGLSCVQLILPWSTPDMRFCTSELKTGIICPELSRQFPGRRIISVSGIRRQESSARAKAPVAKDQPKLSSVTRKTSGVDWHPIIDWTIGDVFTLLRHHRFPLHEAYTVYGASRVSCAYCIMSAANDLKAASACRDNHELYRRMVDLEAKSTFAFQGGKWLADVSPDLLSDSTRTAIEAAKSKATKREQAESVIPKHLVYERGGWPSCIPTDAEAEMLAEVRREVASIVGLDVAFTDAGSVLERYRELMAIKLERQGKAKKKADRAAGRAA